ncbi:phage-related baseplate assembly protein [Ameyamaea chiangmaiensis NBRC 103196]|nr:baseplate assembly protein [Ameyamaea chiangmaiensis]GBQ63886.1 phage-related baseplate assembly protein [Ameyamaea chiangmaiensis NBRC 103196]
MDAAAVLCRTATALHGIVSAVDPENGAVKVHIMPEGIESGWIPDAAGVAAGDLRIARPNCVGSHVLLLPIDGDAEHLAIVGVVFDAVVTPPVSRVTGKVAQPGELLIQTGCGTPPLAEGGQPGAQAATDSWWHMLPKGLFYGSGSVSVAIEFDKITWKAGEAVMIFGSDGLRVSGVDIVSDQDVKAGVHSMTGHVHSNGNQGANTGTAIG